MSLQPDLQPRSSPNGLSVRGVDKDMSARIENKYLPGKSYPSRPTSSHSGIRSDCGSEGLHRDRLVYLTTCLIGHYVDVQVKNGSIYSGILHASNAERDFGVVLRMACLTKDISGRGPKGNSESINKAPSKTLIIPAHELVQIVAKDIPITVDGTKSEITFNRQELLLDSYISKNRHVDGERELKPWVPDEDVPQKADLENTFSSPWNGRWDQFQVNEQLFGVKSTFNEELYTTKLERGSRTWELEQEAIRIAREIEGENTNDLHLAEERGVYSHGESDVDEETRYSSVFRGVDDSGFEDEDAGFESFDTHSTDTFGDSSASAPGRSYAADIASRRAHDEDHILASTSSENETQREQIVNREALSHSSSLESERSARTYHAVEPDICGRIQEEDEEITYSNDSLRTELLIEEHRTTTIEDSQVTLDAKEDSSNKQAVPLQTTVDFAVTGQVKTGSASGEQVEDAMPGKVQALAQPKSNHWQPSSSTSSNSVGGVPSSRSRPALSPSSSVGSLSSEKSTMNSNAKEFKLNPNAKSFVPSPGLVRPVSPVAESSLYYPSNMSAVPHMPGMPVAYGIGPVFPGPQPMMFNPQGVPVQAPQTYYPANQPQFGQPMVMGPRPVVYMPAYPPMGGQQETPYNKGPDF